MKRIEELLKAKLSGAKAEANPALDDALWNRVSSGLNAPVAEVAESAGKTIGLKWAALGGTALFVAGVGVGLVWNDQNLKASSAPVAAAEHSTYADAQLVVEAQSVGREATVVSADAVVPSAALLPSEAKETGPAQTAFSPTLTESAPVAAAPQLPVRRTTASSAMEPAAGTPTPERTVNDISADANPTVEIPSDGLSEADGAMAVISPLRRLPAQLDRAKAREEPALCMGVTASNSPPRHFALRAFGGVTLSNFHYLNDELAMFSDYFHTASSAGGGLALDFDFKNQQWSLGLGWSDYAQRMEFEHSWQTEFVEPDAILSVELDPITGDTLSVETGPVLATVTHHRHVRDFNHWNAVVIPAEWRKQWLISRWTLGMGLGGQFLVRTGAHGQSFIAEGTVGTFADADLSRWRISLSPTARCYAGYQFQPEWRLDVSVAAGFQSLGSLSNEELMSPSIVSWDGQLRTLQIAMGLTRFIELSRNSSLE